MITYNGLDLFSSGPSVVEPGALEGRDALADAPGAIGASVVTQGVLPRKLVQRGKLIADDEQALQSLIDAIQSQVDSGAATLVDQHAKAWPECLMRRFEVETFTRLGPRLMTAYEITYLQTYP